MRLPGAVRRVLEQPVAAHAASPPWALGMATLGVLGLVALTGLLLAVGFDAERERELLAESLALPRGLHAWAASAALVLVLVHLARVAWSAAYRAPRARTWWLGLGALACLLGLFWLGVALRGDQQAFEAWRHGALVLALLGLGSPEADAPVGVLFWLHVLGVPLLLAGVVGLHVLRVRRLDLAPREASDAKRPAPAKVAFRLHVLTGARLAAGVAGLAVLLTLLAPPALGPAPLPGLEAARAPWPFAWLVPLQDVLGTAGILVGLALAFGALAALPLLDARGPQDLARRPAALAVLLMLALLVIGLGLWALAGPAGVRIVA